MRLTDVHDEERDVVLVALVHRVESGNLPPERRSGVTAEYEDDRPLATEGGECDLGGVIDAWQAEIGRRISDPERATPRDVPHRLERDRHHGGHREVRHDLPETLGWLPHRPEHPGQEYQVHHEEACGHSAGA